MAIDSKQIEQAVNASFETVEDFAAMLKLLSGVGQRVRLEVQRDELYRKVTSVQQDLQARQQARQTENVADSQQTEKETLDLQSKAREIQAAIDALNAQLPDLLG